MKRIFFCAFILFSLFFVSCSPKISIQPKTDNQIFISFSTNFSNKGTKALKEIIGAVGDSENSEKVELLSSKELKLILENIGLQNVISSVSKENSINGSGYLQNINSNFFNKIGILNLTNSSITFSLTPSKIQQFYDSLDEEGQGYLDLLMIPCLTGETSTVTEYQELLSSIYGKELADEIINGKMYINLISPDGSETNKIQINLGEVFTLSSDKTWSLNW